MREVLLSRMRDVDEALFGRSRERYALHLGGSLRASTSVLDVGCGSAAALPRMVSGVPRTVGVDLHLSPDLSNADPRHDQYVVADIRSLSSLFRLKSFDVAVALDVIEHLPKDDGWDLVASMEMVARRRVVLFTPNGFLDQPPTPTNPNQEHLSGWTVDDFAQAGYTVVGINGLKALRGPYATIRHRPHSLWERVSRLSQPLTERRPRWAFQLLAYKDL